MITQTIGGQPPQTDKAIQLNDKMLNLAQELFIEEMLADTLFACGGDFTSKVAGQYGMYETCQGEVIAFQPKSTLHFTLSHAELLVTGDLATIEVVARYMDEYNLSLNAA